MRAYNDTHRRARRREVFNFICDALTCAAIFGAFYIALIFVGVM